jgi:hypothetical protein
MYQNMIHRNLNKSKLFFMGQRKSTTEQRMSQGKPGEMVSHYPAPQVIHCGDRRSRRELFWTIEVL